MKLNKEEHVRSLCFQILAVWTGVLGALDSKAVAVQDLMGLIKKSVHHGALDVDLFSHGLLTLEAGPRKLLVSEVGIRFVCRSPSKTGKCPSELSPPDGGKATREQIKTWVAWLLPEGFLVANGAAVASDDVILPAGAQPEYDSPDLQDPIWRTATPQLPRH